MKVSAPTSTKSDPRCAIGGNLWVALSLLLGGMGCTDQPALAPRSVPPTLALSVSSPPPVVLGSSASAAAPSASTAPSAAPSQIPPSLAWYGNVGKQRVALRMTRQGDKLTLTSNNQLKPLALEGRIEGDKVVLRETTSTGALPQEETAEFLPISVHNELARLSSSSMYLLEDVSAGTDITLSRSRILENKETVHIDIDYVELSGSQFKPLNALLKKEATSEVGTIRLAGADLKREILRLNPKINWAEYDGGAFLTVRNDLVLVTPRYVSVHEDYSYYQGVGAHGMNGTWCVTFDRQSGKTLKLDDVFATRDIKTALQEALSGLSDADLSDDSFDLATRPDASVCLTRVGVWLTYGLAYVVQALDGIAAPYARLTAVLRPGIAP